MPAIAPTEPARAAARRSFLPADPARLLAFAGRVAARLAGSRAVFAVRAGVGLGLYDGLARQGPCGAEELAAGCGLDAGYVGEWLAAQLRQGFVRRLADAPRYWLDPEQVAVFVDASSPAFLLGYRFAELPSEARRA